MRKKESITPQQLLKLKESLTHAIKSSFNKVKYLNPRVGEDTEREEEVKELLEDIEFYQLKLIEIKELLVTINNKKHDGDSHTNNYYIYLLSNLTETLNFYVQLRVNQSSPITQEEINKRISSIQRQREQIMNKLTVFNKNRTVKIDLSDARLYELLK